MDEAITPDRATSEYRRRAPVKAAPRPDRFALWAVAIAVVAMFAGLISSDAGAAGGGLSTGGDTSAKKYSSSWYGQIWENTSRRNKRWARRTGECESGNDPNAYNPAGPYLGAFQFLRSTWRTSPKSPGGDPRDYSWRTQAVVAVALKKRDGAGHWPVCG